MAQVTENQFITMAKQSLADQVELFAQRLAARQAKRDAYIDFPDILKHNVHSYMSIPASANIRRINERREAAPVIELLTALNFNHVQYTPTEGTVKGEYTTAKGMEISVEFTYYEYPTRIYKKVVVMKNGKRSNISVLKNMVDTINKAISNW